MNRMWAVLILLLLSSPRALNADDIDVYLASPSAIPAYLHLLIDYRPGLFAPLCQYGGAGGCRTRMSELSFQTLGNNYDDADFVTRFEVLVAILQSVLNEPQYSHIQLSIGVSNSKTGGTILSGFKAAGSIYDGFTGADRLTEILRDIPVPGELTLGHAFQPVESYYEWLAYLNGEQVVNGSKTAQNFGGSISAPGLDSDVTFDGESTAASYRSPLSGGLGCERLYSILLSLGPVQSDHALDGAIRDLLGIGGLGPLMLDQFLEAMHSGGVDLVPDLLPGVNKLNRAWVISDELNSIQAARLAEAGGGEVLDIDDPLTLESGLRKIFSEVAGAAEVAPGPIPHLNLFHSVRGDGDLFLTLFEPRPTIRWRGNVKKLKLVRGQGQLQVVDVQGRPALRGNLPGEISRDAQTFWTDTSALPAPAGGVSLPGTDGGVVNLGGAGQQILGAPGYRNEENARQVFTDAGPTTDGDVTGLIPFDADGVGVRSTAAMLKQSLGARDVKAAHELIRWGRGQDVDDEDADGDTTEARHWLMADSLHSRPLLLSYGAVSGHSSDNPLTRLFLGAGDGSFRAIENTTASGEESGREVFTYYPRELLGNLAHRREDRLGSRHMRYGVDGEPVALTIDTNGDGNLNAQAPDNDLAYVFFGLRRGGYSYYALDVSNPGLPPVLLWKISRSSGGDFDELGLTFSTPVVGRVKFDSVDTPVLIFAGGYHGGWDSSRTTRLGKDRSSDDDVGVQGSVGNALFIVNAITGELVWKAVYGAATDSVETASNTRFSHAGLVDSIPSGVTALRTETGLIHRLYVGDTGGAIWRVDVPVAPEGAGSNFRREHWFINKLAELGTDGPATDRRFFHAPDIVQAREDDGTVFDGVLIGSGNRAAPNETEVVNYLFYVKDAIVSSGNPAARERLPLNFSGDPGPALLPDRSDCSYSMTEGCEVSLNHGWMYRLEHTGEKLLGTPLVVDGKVMFTSYIPPLDSRSCNVETGESLLYSLSLADGSSAGVGRGIVSLGSGIPAEVDSFGEWLITPVSTSGTIEGLSCEGLSCRVGTGGLVPLYWREPLGGEATGTAP